MKGSIRIGTSGWSYRHWREEFYPQGLAARKWLAYYAERFDTTEINGSFYRLPSEKAIDDWAAAVPEGFLFCPKMSRFLTHMKKLNEPEEPLHRFFDIFEPLKHKMGPVLLQLPNFLRFDAGKAAHIYGLLSGQYKAHRFVLEVRHESWLTKEALKLMEQHGIGLVISQSEHDFPYSEAVTAPTVYLRMHGPRELYASAYSDEQLEEYAQKIKKWVKGGHDVWVFFNNDIHGHAVRDAARLRERVEK